MRRDEHRLVEQAAAVVAQVEHDALRALVEQLVDRRAHLAVRAGGEAREPHVRDLAAAVALLHLGLDDRDVDARALAASTLARLRSPCRDGERDLGARRALDQRRRLLGRLAPRASARRRR